MKLQVGGNEPSNNFFTSVNFSRTRKLLQKRKSNASPLPRSLIFDPSSPSLNLSLLFYFFAIHFFLFPPCKPRLLSFFFSSAQPDSTTTTNTTSNLHINNGRH